ncbi:MAG TPA: hypothetical protein VNA69_21925 [Thermoanaerobaculia bacterium]|nr:hypothetical protein [Thermoanaerobaculia bacterium]
MNIKYGAHIVTLGPLSESVYQRAKWAGDGYPAHQIYADELETLLQFAQSNGVLSMYVTELLAKPGQRDAAVAELRVAYLLAEKGFGVVEWRPVGLAPKRGEFLVAGLDARPVFVEVKRRGWEGEVSEEERLAGRLEQPKYRWTEVFWGDSTGAVTGAIEKAYPKFAPENCNLLVIVDDLMFPLGVESDLWARQALYWDDGKFTNADHELLGGVGFAVKKETSQRTWYEMLLYLNPHATTQLPGTFVSAFGGRSLATA